jgi:hypothetical protein
MSRRAAPWAARFALPAKQLALTGGFPLLLPIRKSATKTSIENDAISVICGKSAKNPRFALSIELFAVDAILQPCVGPGTLF